MEVKNFKTEDVNITKINNCLSNLKETGLEFFVHDQLEVFSITVKDQSKEKFGFIEFEQESIVFLTDEKTKNRKVWECSFSDLEVNLDVFIKEMLHSVYERLVLLESKARLATKGTYVAKTQYGNDEPLEDQFNHGGYRTDTQLVVLNAKDQLNEKSYEEHNTELKYRRRYEEEEVLISKFKYRGPAQTNNNVQYFSMLDPEFVLELISLAKKEF